MRRYFLIPLCLFAISLLSAFSPALPIKDIQSHWIRIDSTHFSMLTDVDQEKAHVVLARFEQMRALFGELLMKTRVNMPEPIEIIAFKTAEEYEKVTPTRAGEGLGAGFYLPGDGRKYFVLNLAQEDSWQAVSYYLARVFLDYNYPPAQPWFDEGFAEYFASAKLTDTQMRIGGDPLMVKMSSGNAVPSAASFLQILSTSTWQSLPELFAARPAKSESRRTLFNAQSWIVMHYLLNKEKLSDAGTYLGLVETENLSAEDAIRKAFGMSSEQLGQAVKDYFGSILPDLQAQAEGKWIDPKKSPPLPAPLAADQVGATAHDISDSAAQALISEMALRLPERREQTKLQLDSLIDGEKTETAIAHRALGWYFLEKKDYEKSSEELNDAIKLDPHDIWTHFYLAAGKDRQAQTTGHPIQGVANMIQDLHIVLDWYPEFAEAEYMLAKADLEGGGLRAATDAIRAATKLSPRNEAYRLEMAQVYITGKNWEAATALLQFLSASSDSQLANSAKKMLQELPYLRKYGIAPREAATQPTTPPPPAPMKVASAQKPASPPAAQPAEDTSAENSDEAPAEPQFDRRKTQYLKGKLLAVDCSQSPVALLTITSSGKTMKMRAEDYKSLVLIGADAFSCDWKNLAVSVNYKAGGKSDGDLVSLELH
jgi:tetratricopeptide (TPR) repeat protein